MAKPIADMLSADEVNEAILRHVLGRNGRLEVSDLNQYDTTIERRNVKMPDSKTYQFVVVAMVPKSSTDAPILEKSDG